MADPVKTTVSTVGTPPPKKLFPPLDSSYYPSQLIWLALTFGLLYLLLSKVALPRIGEVIEERGERIKRDLTEADRLKDETKAALASYEQALSEAKGKAGALAKETRDKLSAESDRERGVADAQTARQLADAEKRIAETKSRALAGVGAIASDATADIVAKLTGATASADDIKRALASIKA